MVNTNKTKAKNNQASSNKMKKHTASPSKQNRYPELIPLDAAYESKFQDNNPFYEQPTMSNLLPDIHELQTLPSAPLLSDYEDKQICKQILIPLED